MAPINKVRTRRWFVHTFFDECVQIGQLGQRSSIGDDSAVGHGFIEFGLEALSDIDPAAQFPKQVGKRCGRGINTSDPGAHTQSGPSSSLSPVLTEQTYR